MKSIDLNCDLGEWKKEDGLEKDARIMPFITSCNIACGGHIGDEGSMRKTIQLAIKNRVTIGVHPSYPDSENFGRKVLDISVNDLKSSVVNQLFKFNEILKEEGADLHHIKPHGALYNEAAVNPKVAEAVIKAIREFGVEVPVYCQEGSVFSEIAQKSGLKVMFEVFADRAYEENLRLRSRNLEGAIIHEKEKVLHHIHCMVIDGNVRTHNGTILPIIAQTMCLHSDTEGAVQLAKEIFNYLKSQGVKIVAA